MSNTLPFVAMRYECGKASHVEEHVALEAPLHLIVNGVPFTTTMRTPGHERELARGLLFTEGIVTERGVRMIFVERPDPETGFVAALEITLPEKAIAKTVDGRRTLFASASCGVCGTRSPADIEVYGPPLTLRATEPLDAARIRTMRAAMEGAQPAFAVSGGLHAAAAFTTGGELLTAHEDIGRHNAVDKVIGWLLGKESEGLSPALDTADALFVSGRISYEIVYKAYRAGIPILLAVSAASSMAVETAERLGMTLVGFCRDDRATVYTHGERVKRR